MSIYKYIHIYIHTYKIPRAPARSEDFLFAGQPRHLQDDILVACPRENFRVFWLFFKLLNSLQKDLF